MENGYRSGVESAKKPAESRINIPEETLKAAKQKADEEGLADMLTNEADSRLGKVGAAGAAAGAVAGGVFLMPEGMEIEQDGVAQVNYGNSHYTEVPDKETHIAVGGAKMVGGFGMAAAGAVLVAAGTTVLVNKFSRAYRNSPKAQKAVARLKSFYNAASQKMVRKLKEQLYEGPNDIFHKGEYYYTITPAKVDENGKTVEMGKKKVNPIKKALNPLRDR